MTEAFLQYVWQHQLLEGPLHTADGASVTVERAGYPNSDAGPDFFDARLRIGQVQWAGNVEVHVNASDWAAHHHQDDPSYDNVVLHVVYCNDQPAVTSQGRQLPVLELADAIPDCILQHYELLMNAPESLPVPCQTNIGQLPLVKVSNVLERMAVERMEQKTATVEQMLEESHGNWEQVCYWMVARYFGGKVNAFPFELLARAADWNFLARWRGMSMRVEALLLGQAGLLEGYLQDDYARNLQVDYEALRLGAHLTPMSSHLWKFFRIRPASFPTIRISQFAQLMSTTPNLFSRILEIHEAKELEQLFDVEASEYWQTHYHFDEPAPKHPKRLGRTLADVIIINACVPLLFAYGKHHGDSQYADQALSLLEQLRAEDNHIIRLWAKMGVPCQNALHSQGALQLYNAYCQNRRCLQCPLCYYEIAELKNSAR